MIGLSCYILADTFFVSNGLGANGLTALNLAIPIYSFVHGIGLMFGMGGATKYSIYRGQKEYKNADKSFSGIIYIMSALAVIFMLTGILFSGQLTRLLGADKNVYHMYTCSVIPLLRKRENFFFRKSGRDNQFPTA